MTIPFDIELANSGAKVEMFISNSVGWVTVNYDTYSLTKDGYFVKAIRDTTPMKQLCYIALRELRMAEL